jgi:hypothetical protein
VTIGRNQFLRVCVGEKPNDATALSVALHVIGFCANVPRILTATSASLGDADLCLCLLSVVLASHAFVEMTETRCSKSLLGLFGVFTTHCKFN